MDRLTKALPSGSLLGTQERHEFRRRSLWAVLDTLCFLSLHAGVNLSSTIKWPCLVSAYYVLHAPLGAVYIPPFNLHNAQIDNGINHIVQMRKLRLRKVKYLDQRHATH